MGQTLAISCRQRRTLATSAADGLSVGQLYDSLLLPRGASKGAVKARYFQLAKTLHPDHPGGTNKKFSLVTDVYQRLLQIAPVRTPARDRNRWAQHPHKALL